MIKHLVILVLVVLILVVGCNLNNTDVENFQTQTCDPDDADIRGNTVIDCVRRCGDSNTVCSTDSQGNPINLVARAQNFLNANPNIERTAITDENDSRYLALQNESTCLQRCIMCGWNNEGNNCKCNWSNTCVQQTSQSYSSFKTNWESKDFVVGAIPEDKKITISWTENLVEEDIDSYIIYIFEKNNIGQVLTQKINHSDIVKNQNNCIYSINDLYNNTQYGIQVNKISKHFPGNPKLVKTSNTIYVVPSEINLLNFNTVNNNQKQCESYAENLLNNFVGREFEINLG